MAKIELKQPIVEEIKAHVENAQTAVILNYSGVTVEQDTKLRKAMREAGITYKVYKNTLMKRAFVGTEFEALNASLEGPNAIAISKEDATAPARLVAKFAKEIPNLEMVAGVVEGQFYDAKGMQAISQIPGREELIGRLLGSMQSPIANFARVLNQIAEKNA
jgi:large subunit ribosomal protein L10